MAKNERVVSDGANEPYSFTLRLFDPGMSPIHRAGLGGLACALKYIERAFKNDDLKDKEVPGGPWQNGKPPWDITRVEITLHFGKTETAKPFIKRLFACSFQIKENLIYIPAQHRINPATAILAELQNGLTLTFLQHGKVRTLAKKETPVSYEIDGHPLQVLVKRCRDYRHQDGWSDFPDDRLLSGKPIEVAGPLNPGAVVRHVAFPAQTRIEEPPSLVLPLYFAVVGCLALPINRGSGVLLVPDVTDLLTFAQARPWMTPTGIRDCRIVGGSDAALQAQVRLAASRLAQTNQLPGCYATTFRPTPWAKQQKSRVQAVHIPPCDQTNLRLFSVALAEFPPRIAHTKSKIKNDKGDEKKGGKKKNDKTEYFWADSVVRPLVADNIACGRRWYQGFGNLVRKTGEKLKFERGGLNAMISKIQWEDHGESTVVKAVHEAVRMRYGQIADENKGKPGTMINRWRGEYDRWRLAFAGAKTADQFRHSLCDLVGRAGPNSVLREQWLEVLPMLDAGRWQLTRDLALLALASYKGKGADLMTETDKEPAGTVE